MADYGNLGFVFPPIYISVILFIFILESVQDLVLRKIKYVIIDLTF